MSFNLKNLELFVRVAALKGIGKAGEELGFSATNASMRIQSLEEELGAKLLYRTTRSISLTVDGEIFLEHSKRVLENIEEAKLALSGTEKTPKGTLRVTAPASFARSHIIPFLPKFIEKHPNINIDLHLSDAIIDIVEQGFDLAFRIGELAPSTLLARKIDENPEMLVASPTYIKKHGIPKSPSDLQNHMCIPLGRHGIWQLKGEDSISHSVEVSGPIQTNFGDAIADLVLAGMGIGRASLWRAGDDLKAGKLIAVLNDYTLLPEDKKIWAVRPPNRMMPKRVQIFLDFMERHIKEANSKYYEGLI